MNKTPMTLYNNSNISSKLYRNLGQLKEKDSSQHFTTPFLSDSKHVLLTHAYSTMSHNVPCTSYINRGSTHIVHTNTLHVAYPLPK